MALNGVAPQTWWYSPKFWTSCTVLNILHSTELLHYCTDIPTQGDIAFCIFETRSCKRVKLSCKTTRGIYVFAWISVVRKHDSYLFTVNTRHIFRIALMHLSIVYLVIIFKHFIWFCLPFSVYIQLKAASWRRELFGLTLSGVFACLFTPKHDFLSLLFRLTDLSNVGYYNSDVLPSGLALWIYD